MAAVSDTPVSLGNRKLVVLGIPWDVDTDGLKQFMSKYGELSDVIVMKDRGTGRSRGFGYVTFASSESAEKALSSSHFLNGRMLDVKVATPKESMPPSTSASRKKNVRIFVARVPLTVTEEAFRSYFEQFGTITDLYMPKEKGSPSHRGIGFVTFEDAESVDKIMSETHQLGGSTIAVDRATPKEDGGKGGDKFGNNLPYGVFNSYLSAAARMGFFGMTPFFPMDYIGGGYGLPNEMGGKQTQGKGGMGSELPTDVSSMLNKRSAYASSGSGGGTLKPTSRKIFVGRIPMDASADEVRAYFGKFGPLLDVYLPKDKDKTTHRGFGFVTFAEESSVEQVVARTHELHGQMLAIDQAAPMGEAPSMGPSYNPSSAATSTPGAGGPGPIRGGNLTASSNSGYGTLSAVGGYDYNNPWGMYSSLSTSSSKAEPRYRPY
ncbi:hypothetical protein KP509_27G020300 [Ceratopteris richardii]|uniref:RRM domain-containing protein n=2 Tax=Ceratopteris richardii TaxID=49495 RepID=A0A8T2RG66_CERRI|nr:hypothetical protein KP509_27G020300 [Ceratopteris richardii]KAH7294814.1 hypothetical protein KP509_27G020300 [Ceratopteris richardii]